MLPSYSDIRSLIDRAPDWFDGGGVPRYLPFTPGMLGVYDDRAILAEIECQSCRQRFLVGEGWSKMDDVRSQMIRGIPGKDIHFLTIEELAEGYAYGDPPRHGCAGAGETMSSELVRIVEMWAKDRFEWTQYEWDRK